MGMVASFKSNVFCTILVSFKYDATGAKYRTKLVNTSISFNSQITFLESLTTEKACFSLVSTSNVNF